MDFGLRLKNEYSTCVGVTVEVRLLRLMVKGDGGGEVDGVVKNVGHVRATGRRLVTPVSRRCVPIIRRWIPWRRKCKKRSKVGKNMGIRSVRRGIRKWRAKAPQGEGKGPKNFRIPILTLLIPIFFPNFWPFFTLPSSGYPPPDDRHAPSTNRGDQPTASRPYMTNILYYTLNFTSTVSPSPWSGGA